MIDSRRSKHRLPNVPEGLFQCVTCEQWKPKEDFNVHNGSKTGRRSKCKVCRNTYKREWAAKRAEDRIPKTKACKECGETKPAQEFHRSRTSKDGLVSKCHGCSSAYYRKNYSGWSNDEVVEAFKAQDGKCAICETEMELDGPKSKKPRADHCHETGRKRALLCNHCNLALGHMKDDPTRLRKAAEFLEGFQA
ncbi:endonuclease VII domain-containing protein [Candidatus Macondimonas diazotrophica]|uniref:endonuclease VII domain-containing protein n=1 Tax=Candidatus Macondimonas diazotrophica TaxID=2305248 RepID=UPI003BEEE027